MLVAYSQLLQENPMLFVALFGSAVLALVCGISFHEFSHAFTADRLGDPTARNLGRVSLNPLRHLEPFGALMLLFAGFGWGRPVPVNPYRLRNGPQKGQAIVAAAGPASNLLLAAIAAVPLRLGLTDWHSPFLIPRSIEAWGTTEYLGLFLSSLIIFNVVLCVFNMLPIAPLDGFSVAVGLLPRDMAQPFARLEQYGPGILMILLVMPFVTAGHVSILHEVMSPVINSLTEAISGGGRALV